MEKFTRYFSGLSWEVEQGIKDTEKSKHCHAINSETISEGYGRTSIKVTFVDNTEGV